MDDELFKSFINKIDENFIFKETVLSPLPPPLLLLLLLLLLSLLLSSFDYELKLKLKLLPAICVHSFLYLPV